MLRITYLLVAAAAVVMISSDARAAEPTGNVDQSALAAMGLGDLQVMSDEEGKEVRGTFAIVGGAGFAFYNGNTPWGNVGASGQGDFYLAGDGGPGTDFAVGANGQVAGGTTNYIGLGFGGPGSFSVNLYSAGGSIAFAGN
ncbi:hypothetical protein AB1K70_19610 [Bremerella sp. JC770]|uniref:hypothetical protein n=1 Tax=Bremerella sp. JC770 TaxID=3232137 RepID=UPI003459EAC3